MKYKFQILQFVCILNYTIHNAKLYYGFYI